jgi:predicted tellurium resistance membrane protein TerC
MEWTSSPEAWIALLTLTVLETVLGIDNIIFVAIIAERVREESRAKARKLGLTLAVITRILLLFSIVWIMRLTQPLFEVFGHAVSGRDLILLTGGLFLLYKATHEIHQKLEGEDPNTSATEGVSSFASVIVQIMLLDIVFSIDSVVTAVGLAEDLAVMVIAVLISGVIMIISANPVSQFVGDHPTVRMLALAFLLLIGMALVAEGMGQHIPKGYIYFAMGFSVLVEVLNLKAKPRQGPGLLRGSMMFDTKKR